MLQRSSLYIQRKGDVVISTISMNNLPIGHVSSTSTVYRVKSCVTELLLCQPALCDNKCQQTAQ